MKFIQAWLNNQDGILKANNIEMVSLVGTGNKCIKCPSNTVFYHKEFQVFMCSTECLKELNDDYHHLHPEVVIQS